MRSDLGRPLAASVLLSIVLASGAAAQEASDPAPATAAAETWAGAITDIRFLETTARTLRTGEVKRWTFSATATVTDPKGNARSIDIPWSIDHEKPSPKRSRITSATGEAVEVETLSKGDQVEASVVDEREPGATDASWVARSVVVKKKAPPAS